MILHTIISADDVMADLDFEHYGEFYKYQFDMSFDPLEYNSLYLYDIYY